MRSWLTFLFGGVAALTVSMIAIGPAGAAPPAAGTPTSRPMPPAERQTPSRAQTTRRGSLIVVDADRLIARYDALHGTHLSANGSRYQFIPDPQPTGGIESDTNGDGIVDDLFWQFSDGTWERVVDYDFDSDADALAIDVTADGFAEVQIWDNEDGTYSYYQDSDGDAVFETEESFTRSELDDQLPGIADLLDINFGPIGG